MSSLECCHTCKYCKEIPSSSNSWCLLRKIKLHSDFTSYVFCHHWTNQQSAIPLIDATQANVNKQLDFGKELIMIEN
ncbi:metal-binding protein [Prochlorococcus marinus]|uniref:metal-binding protein n=1 Tax=Prochlorococcus marinus TaxID=1219 RepID=UPI0022B464D9|nr:metal-binding protein [Prochlorococcus marinus]